MYEVIREIVKVETQDFNNQKQGLKEFQFEDMSEKATWAMDFMSCGESSDQLKEIFEIVKRDLLSLID